MRLLPYYLLILFVLLEVAFGVFGAFTMLVMQLGPDAVVRALLP